MAVTLKITGFRYVAPCSLVAVPTFQSTLKVVVARLSKTSVNIYHTIWRHNPKYIFISSVRYCPLLTTGMCRQYHLGATGEH
jgi:hypothetical protein